MHTELFRIAQRFCGPPRSGNGGYVAGRIARHLGGSVAVRLKAPPPLDTELRLETLAEQSRLFDRDTLIGEGKVARLEMDVPPPPSLAQAREASPAFIGFHAHAFPGCFVCGTQRQARDGLRIFPGAVAGTSLIAAPWLPDDTLVDTAGHVQPEFLWSALDCTGGFAVYPAPAGSAFVLGELCTSIVGTARAGEPCVVTGWGRGQDGRKRYAGSALHAADGRLVALASAVWVEVPLSSWG